MFYEFDNLGTKNPSFYGIGDKLRARELYYCNHAQYPLWYTRRHAKMQAKLLDRRQFVQLGYGHWSYLAKLEKYHDNDLSAEVLGNGHHVCESTQNKLLHCRIYHTPGEPSIDLRMLHTIINAPQFDYNEYMSEYNRTPYHALLQAYFSVTTELDILARNEPEASDDAKKLIAQRIAQYATPVRNLLLELAHYHMSDTGYTLAGTDTVDRVHLLIESWADRMPLESEPVKALTKQIKTEFVKEQSDTRIRMALGKQL